MFQESLLPEPESPDSDLPTPLTTQSSRKSKRSTSSSEPALSLVPAPIKAPKPKSTPKSSKKSKDSALLEKGIQLAARLDRPNKIALIQAIEALLESEEDEMDEAELEMTRQSDAKLRQSEGRGRIESKLIPRNGKHYGPYLYLRWWLGKIYKSTYISKG